MKNSELVLAAFKQQAEAEKEINSRIPTSLVCALIRARGWSDRQAFDFEFYAAGDGQISAHWDEYHSGETDRYDITFPASMLDLSLNDELAAAITAHGEAYKEEQRLKSERKKREYEDEQKAKELRQLAQLQAKYSTETAVS